MVTLTWPPLKIMCCLFALLHGKLHGSVVREPTHTALNSEYGTVFGVPFLFKQSGDGMLDCVSIVDKPVTAAYKVVHFINPECAANRTWSLSSVALTTIPQGLYLRKVHAPIVALRPYAGMQLTPAIPTMKECQHQCQHGHMSVKGKGLVKHMQFHIARAQVKAPCPPCLSSGDIDGACPLRMQRAKTADAH